MRKFVKLAAVGVLSLSMGVAAMPSNTLNVLAKTKAAKVISSKNIKKTAYHINAGYLYSSAKLTKKRHNGKNYLKTTFYATKSAHVKKANGKKAVYYYIKNSKGSVKGWAWHGNLTKFNVKAAKQHKSDIKKLVAIVRTMSPDDQDSVLSNFTGINTNMPYYNLANAIDDMGLGDTIEDAKAMSAAYHLFAGRFDSATNAQLSAQNSRLEEATNSANSDSDYSTATYNLGSSLFEAVTTLK
ncbi:hypothetical protein [Lactiplantibacillus songbeiensis]|uniref:D-alanyl-D-alanine carboxypeptidase n=1 Tax=Lactiplantibacillus songbeiensis TaxID=2559920 RepID=A0ABW4C5S3_9LACO|nr:hypothetical protein [Lactiplantibacillus songbeiensis]